MKVTLLQMLAAKENRSQYQKYLLKKYCKTLISFTLNIPGEKKQGSLYRKLHDEGMREIAAAVKKENISFRQVRHLPTGSEGFAIVKEDHLTVKILACSLEEEHPLGRLFDIDVFTCDGKLISRASLGLDKRQCILCGEDAAVCGRLQHHTYKELVEQVKKQTKNFFRQGEK